MGVENLRIDVSCSHCGTNSKEQVIELVNNEGFKCVHCSKFNKTSENPDIQQRISGLVDFGDHSYIPKNYKNSINHR